MCLNLYCCLKFRLGFLIVLLKNFLTCSDINLFIFQDQYDQIAVHTQKGIDFLEKYGHFVDARSKIEAEYAQKLR